MSGNEGISESLYNIKHKSAAETYDASTDSLEAISDTLIAAGLGVSDPIHAYTQGTSYVGIISTATGTPTVTFESLELAGFGNDFFNTKWHATIIRKNSSHGSAPEGESRVITDYVSTTGAFTVSALSAAIAVDDVVLITKDAISNLNLIPATTTTDGSEQTLWEIASPTTVFESKSIKLDCTNMVVGDQIRIRLYYKIKTGGNYIKESDVYITDAQDPDLHTFDLLSNRFGVKATITRILGTDRAYDSEVAYSS